MEQLKVPNGFSTLQQLQEIHGRRSSKKLVSVIGLVKDFHPPKPTRGSDHICSIELVDQSLLSGVNLSMFWPLDHMPSELRVADVVIISKVNIDQKWEHLALLASKTSIIYVISNRDNRNTIRSSRTTLSWNSYSYGHRPNDQIIPAPAEEQIKFAKLLNERKNKILKLPPNEDFVAKSSQPRSYTGKFSLVKDVQVNNYYDIIGEVIKIWPSNGCVSVYITDYTSNSRLYEYSSDTSRPETEGREGDEYSYCTMDPDRSLWPGPCGKLTIQITLWDLSAEYAMDNVNPGQWLYLKNVQMKNGRENDILEGKVRCEPNKKGIVILEKLLASSEIHSRWKTAIERGRAWWANQKKAKKKSQSVDTDLRKKRKFTDNDYENGDTPRAKDNKIQRKKKKKSREETYCSKINERARELDINKYVEDSNPDKVIVPIKDILSPSLLRSDPDKIYAPFTNHRYKAIVRVIDYFPHTFEDFIVDLPANEANDLSEGTHNDHGSPKTSNWEWRFALLLEDASSITTLNKAKIWVFVNNQAATDLLDLGEDTIDPRENVNHLGLVQEKFCTLWGNLGEEKKKHLELKRYDNRGSPCFSPTLDSNLTPSPGNQPDLDSDVEKVQSRHEIINRKAQTTTPTRELLRIPEILSNKDQSLDKDNIILQNKPFRCCIQQYGVKVPEEDPTKANAGPGCRWERVFGLFGTKIL